MDNKKNFYYVRHLVRKVYANNFNTFVLQSTSVTESPFYQGEIER